MNLKKLQSLETKVARAEEALAAIKALAEIERNELLAERDQKKSAVKPVATTRTAKESDEDRRGYAGRNGRMDIIREVVQKMGTSAKTSDVFKRVNDVSVERGLEPIKKAAFYTLISEVRRERTTVDFKPGIRDVVADTGEKEVKSTTSGKKQGKKQDKQATRH